MSCVAEINDIRELAELRPLWRFLLKRTRDASFLQSQEWLEAYWQHFGEGQKLRVLLVSQDGETDGIVPLVVRNERTRFGTLRYLTYPLDHWGSFYGPIGPNPGSTLTEALRHIRKRRRDWDVLELRWVRDNEADASAAERALRAAAYHAEKQPWAQTSLITVSGTFEDYWSERSRDLRSECERYERRLSNTGQVTWVRHRPLGENAEDTDPRWDLYEQCEQITQRNWIGTSANGEPVTNPSALAFLRTVHERACRAGAVDVNLLLVNGNPVAFDYGYHYQGCVNVVRTAFDASVEGVEAVLMGRWIRDSYEREDNVIDLGPGLTLCKQPWQTAVATSCRLTSFSGTAVRAQRLHFDNWAGKQLRRLARAVGRPVRESQKQGATDQ